MREVIQVDGLDHGAQPIPLAVRLGDLVFTGGVSGRAPHGSSVPDDLEDEVAQAFVNLGSILSAAGLSPEHIGRITVYTTDRSHREVINKYWLEMFPDASNRPVRHTLLVPLNNMRVQLDCIAVHAKPPKVERTRHTEPD
jgi:2-iminobutanoate/2-iminopropanoate deaminase